MRLDLGQDTKFPIHTRSLATVIRNYKVQISVSTMITGTMLHRNFLEECLSPHKLYFACSLQMLRQRCNVFIVRGITNSMDFISRYRSAYRAVQLTSPLVGRIYAFPAHLCNVSPRFPSRINSIISKPISHVIGITLETETRLPLFRTGRVRRSFYIRYKLPVDSPSLASSSRRLRFAHKRDLTRRRLRLEVTASYEIV